MVWCKISLRGVRESYTGEDEETALNDLNVCMIRKCLVMQLLLKMYLFIFILGLFSFAY